MSTVYQRLLKETHKRNTLIRADFRTHVKYIWCPIRVGDFPNRRLDRIIQYVYAEGRLSDKNFSVRSRARDKNVRDFSEMLLEFDENRWLKSNLEDIIREKLEKFHPQWEEYQRTNDLGNLFDGDLPEKEVAILIDYHESKTSFEIDLIYTMIVEGILKTKPDWNSDYIYFRSVKTSELNEDEHDKYVVKKPEFKTFLWMDVGGWSPHSAVVGIVTPHEVAMYDIYGSRSCRGPPAGTLAGQVLKSLKGAIGRGETIFYKNLKNIRQIKTPLINDEVVFVLPDLHLHLFKGYKVDNFKQPRSGGRSLDEILEKVLSVINHWNSKKRVTVVQVGDLYELWESAMLLGMGLNPNKTLVTATYWEAVVFRNTILPKVAPWALPLIKPPSRKEMETFLKSIEAEAKRRKLDEIFSKPELDKLRLPWAIVEGDRVKTNAEIKDVWEKIQKEIEKLHQGLFKKSAMGKFNTLVSNQTIIAGNHDSFLDHVYVREEGIKKVVRSEHLHYNDEYNKPSNMRAGQFMTILNLIAELLGFGDQVKELETSRRPEFLTDTITINWERCKEGKPLYDLIITGHTHRAFASLIEMKLSKSTFPTPKARVLYDQGWTKEISKYQYYELAKFARKNLNCVLAGLAAMGWRGLITTLYLFIAKRIPGPPFPIEKPSKPFPVE